MFSPGQRVRMVRDSELPKAARSGDIGTVVKQGDTTVKVKWDRTGEEYAPFTNRVELIGAEYDPAPYDAVAHPQHYKSHPSGVEVIEITQHENFCIGNVIKYVLRAQHKGKHLEDLRKAKQYLEFEITRVEALNA